MSNETHNDTVLVTGGSGFVAGWMIFGLLERGYTVKASLRSLGRQDEVVAAIAGQGGDVRHTSTFI